MASLGCPFATFSFKSVAKQNPVVRVSYFIFQISLSDEQFAEQPVVRQLD